MMTGARPMAGLAHYTSDEFPLLPAESALLRPFFLLQAVLRWKLFLVARLAISVITTLGFRIRLAASRLMEPATIRLDLAGMGTAHQDAEAEHLEEEPQDSQPPHGARFEWDKQNGKCQNAIPLKGRRDRHTHSQERAGADLAMRRLANPRHSRINLKAMCGTGSRHTRQIWKT